MRIGGKAPAVKIESSLRYRTAHRPEIVGDERAAIHRQLGDVRYSADQGKRTAAFDNNVPNIDRHRVPVRYGKPVFADQLYRDRYTNHCIGIKDGGCRLGSRQNRVAKNQRPAAGVIVKIVILFRGFGIAGRCGEVTFIVCVFINVHVIDAKYALRSLDSGNCRRFQRLFLRLFHNWRGRCFHRRGRCFRWCRCRFHGYGCFRFRIVGQRRNTEARQRNADADHGGKNTMLHSFVPPCSVSRAVLPVFTLYYAGTAHALQDILARMPKRVKNRLFFFETADFRAYSISAGGSRRVMLRRLTVSVYALCSSAEVAGGRMPATPRQISIKLKPMMFR